MNRHPNAAHHWPSAPDSNERTASQVSLTTYPTSMNKQVQQATNVFPRRFGLQRNGWINKEHSSDQLKPDDRLQENNGSRAQHGHR